MIERYNYSERLFNQQKWSCWVSNPGSLNFSQWLFKTIMVIGSMLSSFLPRALDRGCK